MISVPLGGVSQLNTGVRLQQLSAGDTEVIEISALDTFHVLIKGKKVGSTALMVWGRDGEKLEFQVQVGLNIDMLNGTLTEFFPNERISFQGSGETLVLRGTTTSLEAMHSITEWIEGYITSLGSAGGRLNFINLLQLPSAQQVQLEVRFAEISRTAMRKMGMNLTSGRNGFLGGLFSAQGDTPVLHSPGAIPFSMPPAVSESISFLFQTSPNARLPFNLILNVLNSRSLARTLSEPNLVAMSGEKAEFLVGGEIPVPIPMGFNQVSIEYKKFGVQLEFTPIVLADRTIQLEVGATVSDLDFSRTIKLQGFDVPGLTTRRSETTVRLRSGQSFAIAGLMSDKVRSMVDKVPLLGDIPILGMLFRSTQFQREETELIVVVTANLVEPLDAREMPSLPGEHDLFHPNDLELFLLGWGDVQRPDPDKPQGRPAGRVGYRQ